MGKSYNLSANSSPAINISFKDVATDNITIFLHYGIDKGVIVVYKYLLVFSD